MWEPNSGRKIKFHPTFFPNDIRRRNPKIPSTGYGRLYLTFFIFFFQIPNSFLFTKYNKIKSYNYNYYNREISGLQFVYGQKCTHYAFTFTRTTFNFKNLNPENSQFQTGHSISNKYILRRLIECILINTFFLSAFPNGPLDHRSNSGKFQFPDQLVRPRQIYYSTSSYSTPWCSYPFRMLQEIVIDNFFFLFQATYGTMRPKYCAEPIADVFQPR